MAPQSSAFFCEDFDKQADVTSFLSSWSNFEQSGGSFRFDRIGVPSLPNALGVVGGKGASVIAIKTFPALPQRPTSVRLEFALRINSAGNVIPLSAAGFAAIAYGTTFTDAYVAMAIGSGPEISAAWVAAADAGASDAGAYQVAPSQAPFPSTGIWAGRFAIEVDYAAASTAGGACAQIYQGPTAMLGSCLHLPPSMDNPGVLSIAVGDLAAGLGDTGAVDFEFDNLTFNVVY
jgi:hypothetical protein